MVFKSELANHVGALGCGDVRNPERICAASAATTYITPRPLNRHKLAKLLLTLDFYNDKKKPQFK